MNLVEFLRDLNGKYTGLNMKKEIVAAINVATTFLPSNSSLLQRVWHILHETEHPPICKNPQCNNLCSWVRSKNHYALFCCTRCSNKYHNEYSFKHEKIKTSLLLKHGVDNAMKVEAFKQKQQRTTEARHGVPNISLLPSVIDEKEERYQQLHGVTNPRKDPTVKERIRQTLEKRYNTNNYLKIIDRKKLNQQFFQRDNPSQRHITTENLANLNDPQWLYDQHIVLQRTATDIAQELGVFCSTVCYKIAQQNIEIQRRNTSQPQRDIIKMIQGLCPTEQILINDRSVIGPYELDILIPNKHVAIEYCGLYWHCDAHDRITKDYHYKKFAACEERGIQLLTIFEDEWLFNQEKVSKMIAHKLGYLNQRSVNARDTHVVPINFNDWKVFFDDTHIQSAPPKVGIHEVYGLREQDGTLVACCAVTKRNKEYEIVRYSTNANIRGGFSKLLSHIKRQLPPKSKIITFADLRHSNGKLYVDTGFTLTSRLPPDYSYVEGFRRVHKSKYRHKYLPGKLEHYDHNDSENGNTKRNNVFKIFNCGLYKFELIT